MRRNLLGNFLVSAGLGFFAVIVLLPFWWVMSSSIKKTNEIISITPTMVPHSFTLAHFDKLLRSSDFLLFLANSLIVAFGAMVITVVLAALAGYAFFRLTFPGQGFLYRLILVGYAFPGIVVLVPLYGMMSAAHLIDNLLALVIIDVTFALPFAIWMMRAFLVALLNEVEEVAHLDGASHMMVLLRVIVPMIAPGLASVAIFAFVSSWTEYPFAWRAYRERRAQDAARWACRHYRPVSGRLGADARRRYSDDHSRCHPLRLHRPLFRHRPDNGRGQVGAESVILVVLSGAAIFSRWPVCAAGHVHGNGAWHGADSRSDAVATRLGS